MATFNTDQPTLEEVKAAYKEINNFFKEEVPEDAKGLKKMKNDIGMRAVLEILGKVTADFDTDSFIISANGTMFRINIEALND